MLYPTAIYPVFLVALLAVYWTAPAHWRKHVLSAGSLALLTYLSWQSTAAFLALTAVVYAVGQQLRDRTMAAPRRTRLMAVGVGLPVLYLCTFKYLPEYAPPIAALLDMMAAGELLLPLGISYFCFKFIHYVIEARRGTLPAHDFVDFLAYASLFATFAAGPIERFTRVQPQLGSPRSDAASAAEGVQRIVFGMIKKVLIADLLIVAVLDQVSVAGRNPQQASFAAQAVYLWCRFLYIYFDFSGYSDIAIGTGRLFGLTITENFDWPLARRNLSEFWRSWHMSLSSWCRDYIYFPVLGKTRNPKLAVYASMLVLGYWHGANPVWICWGAWHASGLAVWQMWQTAKRQRPQLMQWSRESRVYRVAASALTLNFVALGAVWQSSGSVRQALRFLYYMVMP